MRKVDSHHKASEAISAASFIPRFLEKKAEDLVRDRGNVGVRGFNCCDYAQFSPYLTLSDITVGPPLMFPDHPHCGHDMMLYVIDGEFVHEDFMGYKETFQVGDVHWMTTGKGIIHAQVPGNQPNNRHVQFWINLPKDRKYCEPGNQVLRASKTPIINDTEGVEIRLLAGEYGTQRSPINTSSPLLMADIIMKPNTITNLNIPGEFFIGTYVLSGNGSIGEQAISKGSVTLSHAGPTIIGQSTLKCSGGSEGLRFLLYAGTPINDPINVDGFFVCCNHDETAKAVTDFDQRINSFAGGKSWLSNIAHQQQ